MSAASEKHSRRHKNGDYNIDSGVYSASSSRDGTPVRGGGGGGGAGGSGQQGVVLVVGGSPKHRSGQLSSSSFSSSTTSSSSSEHNGLPASTRLSQREEKGEGVYLDDTHHHQQNSRINPVSLNLVSKSIDHSPVRPPRSMYGGSMVVGRNGEGETAEGKMPRLSPGVIRRSSSEKPLSSLPSLPDKEQRNQRESKSVPRGENEVRSVSPLQDYSQDIKLVRRGEGGRYSICFLPGSN